ncbi:MAG: hypothetical protein AAGA88_12060 [Pseudomonadota bacterium]
MKRRSAFVFGLLPTLGLLASPTMVSAEHSAVTKAAEYLVNEQITDACGDRGGIFHAAGIIEQDLDGDGLLDLILDHHQLVCDELTHGSGHCEYDACQVLVYVRRDGLLVLKKAYLSIGVSVTKEIRPVLGLMDAEERSFSVQWDEDDFRILRGDDELDEDQPALAERPVT